MPSLSEFSGLHFLAALAVVSSLWAFALAGIDKRAAGRGARRVSERSLILPVLFGGAPGLLAGMLAFRHKTAKRSFQLKFAGAFALYAATLLWTYR